MFGNKEWVEWAGTDLMLGKIAEIEENRHVEEEIFAKAEEIRAEAARKAEEVRIKEEACAEAQRKVLEACTNIEHKLAMQRRVQEEARASGAFGKSIFNRNERPLPKATGGNKDLVRASLSVWIELANNISSLFLWSNGPQAEPPSPRLVALCLHRIRCLLGAQSGVR